jgi:thiol:disulfide interchange protein DsbD
MGAAVGYAATQPPLIAVAVFEGVALGLAAPYVLIAFIPALVKLLPRPGVWMDRLKEILAFPLYGAAAWLMWVLAQQVGPSGLALGLAGAVCIALAGWSWGRAIETPSSRYGWGLVASAAVSLAAVAAGNLPEGGSPSMSPGVAIQEPFTSARLAELRSAGKPVLVDFTAAWCLTCLINERGALSSGEVTSALHSQGITYMKADWTNRNPEITRALHDLGRDGVPAYVWYPKLGSPTLLPQILTPPIVLKAISAAAG